MYINPTCRFCPGEHRSSDCPAVEEQRLITRRVRYGILRDAGVEPSDPAPPPMPPVSYVTMLGSCAKCGSVESRLELKNEKLVCRGGCEC